MKKKQEELLETFAQGIKALGINHGAAKGDIKLTSRGPMIGEIAARLSGGYMSGWTYPYASGVEPTRGAIMVATGKRPDKLEPVKYWTSAERAFISIPGTVKSVRGVEEAGAVKYVKEIFLRTGEGSQVRFPENNVSKCGNIISAAPTREEAVHAADFAARTILIRLDTRDHETEAFLTSETDFPPGAFILDAALVDQLESLPKGNITLDSGKSLSIYPFPDFTQSGILDYTGRSIAQVFAAAGSLTGYTLEIIEPDGPPKDKFLGREFWQSLIRGGYQGAVYYIDSLSAEQITQG